MVGQARRLGPRGALPKHYLCPSDDSAMAFHHRLLKYETGHADWERLRVER